MANAHGGGALGGPLAAFAQSLTTAPLLFLQVPGSLPLTIVQIDSIFISRKHVSVLRKQGPGSCTRKQLKLSLDKAQRCYIGAAVALEYALGQRGTRGGGWEGHYDQIYYRGTASMERQMRCYIITRPSRTSTAAHATYSHQSQRP
jgi:hypothetical protein